MPKYEKEDAEPTKPMAKPSMKTDTTGDATNVLWSTKKGTLSICKPVTPSAANQTRSR
jgi:hypothetical protein